MKLGFLTTLAFSTAVMLPVAAIAQTTIAQTTIGEMQRANTTTLTGEVVRVRGDNFILSDGTGQILVEAETRSIRQANLATGDRITVAGRYDDDNEFEAVTLTPANGQAIYVFDD